jgi:DNA-nicking Smr family endonuclease
MAGRRLSPEEAALWQRVAFSVRPVAARASRVEEARHLREGHGRLLPREKDTGLCGIGAIAGGHPKPSANTLDGGWDRKIGTGRVVPERTIDLHGHSLASAHHRLDRGLADAIRDGVRVILLVTGRAPRNGGSRIDLPMRGIIRESIGDWLAASRHKSAIAAIRNAHPRHGGAGALYLILRRAR